VAKYKVAGNSEVKIDNTAGSLVNLTSYIDSMSVLGKQFGALDVTTFADGAESFIAGIEESQEFTITGPFDDTTTTGPDVVLANLPGTIGSVEFHPVGTASGNRKMLGEFLCTFYRVNASVKERVTYEAGFRQTGSITFAAN
jgi:hypothetical protein